jgi:hypothetical protein
MEFVKIIDGIPVKFYKKVIHRFSMSDVDDVDLYVAGPLYAWQSSEEGKFVFEHAIETPEWHKMLRHDLYMADIRITAIMSEKHFVEYYLKFGK